MIKAVVTEEHYSSGCGEWAEIADDPEKVPEIMGAEFEEYLCRETLSATTIKTYEQEARLREDGTPYIHSWAEYTPQQSYEDWCQEGFEHTQTKIEGKDGWPKWAYTRTVKKYRWIVRIETLEQLEELLEMGISLSSEHYSHMPDIEYAVRI